jgi:hypothetical protein
MEKKSDIIKAKVKILFLSVDAENTTPRKLAAMCKEEGFPVGKTTISDWIRKENWESEREKIQQTAISKVAQKVVTLKAEAKARSIRQVEAVGNVVFEKLMLKLDAMVDGLDEQKLISIKDFVALQDIAGKLHGYVAGSGGGAKTVNFIINVPPDLEYLTPKGIEYIRRKMQSPTLTDDNQAENKDKITLQETEYSVEEKVNGGKDE